MRRILFVDDEPRILDGLRRMLHDERAHWDGTRKAKTSHSLAKVPFAIYNGPEGTEMKAEGDFGLANVAATVVELLGFEKPEEWLEAIIK